MCENRPKYGKNDQKFTEIKQKVKVSRISVANKEQFHEFIEEHVRQWFMNREFGKVTINCKDGTIKVSREDWIN